MLSSKTWNPNDLSWTTVFLWISLIYLEVPCLKTVIRVIYLIMMWNKALPLHLVSEVLLMCPWGPRISNQTRMDFTELCCTSEFTLIKRFFHWYLIYLTEGTNYEDLQYLNHTTNSEGATDVQSRLQAPKQDPEREALRALLWLQGQYQSVCVSSLYPNLL